MKNGDLKTAHQKFDEAISQGSKVAFNNKGVAFQKQGDTSNAIAYYKHAARWGIPMAAKNLQHLNQKVPSADLLIQHQEQERMQKEQEARELQRSLELFVSTQEAINQGRSNNYYEPPQQLSQPSKPLEPIRQNRQINCSTVNIGNYYSTNCNLN